MKIITGIGLDKRRPNKIKEQLGEITCGEFELIELLEFRAGIYQQKMAFSKRIITYLNALKVCDNGNRFYSKSLKVDPIACAETLIYWRDWAIMHGWLNEGKSRSRGRLADLEIVENSLQGSLFSIGERIYNLFDQIDLICKSISEIKLLNNLDEWPQLYRTLFAKLADVGIHILEKAIPITTCASEHTDLGKLQREFLKDDIKTIELNNDGSINIFQANNTQVAASCCARLANLDSLIIADNQLHSLDVSSVVINGMSTGVGETSSTRAANQLLLLILQCAWKTPSADVVLQYLTLPFGKFKKLRQSLARTFRDKPGINSRHWKKIIEDYIQSKCNADSNIKPDILTVLINDWLPISLNDSDKSMPTHLVIELCKRVTDYWRSFLYAKEDQATDLTINTAYQIAIEAAEALKTWGDEKIDCDQLNRLVSMFRDMGQTTWQRNREVTNIDIVQNPEVVTLREGELQHLIWLNPKLSKLETIPPFSTEEFSGIPFAPDKKKQTKLQQYALTRAFLPILSTSKSITLIASDTQPDLFKLKISAILGSNEWPNLEASILTHEFKNLDCKEIQIISLPKPKRWLKVNSVITVPRTIESYSSLKMLVYKPYEYVFKYAAGIQEDPVHGFPLDARLKGILAHYIIEAWFNENPWMGSDIQKEHVTLWLNNRFETIIHECALPFAQPGKKIEQQSFKKIMHRALTNLLEILASAKIVRVTPELRLTHQTNDYLLEGTLDLFCERDNKQCAIIDMKWGSHKRYRDELKNGYPLQLATYAKIAESKENYKICDAAFFIINDATLLSTSGLIFSSQRVIQSSQNFSLDDIWQRFKKVLDWRMDQLRNGWVEITYGNAEDDEYSQPPEDSIPLFQKERSSDRSEKSYNKNYKQVDPWRNITGNVKEF